MEVSSWVNPLNLNATPIIAYVCISLFNPGITWSWLAQGVQARPVVTVSHTPSLSVRMSRNDNLPASIILIDSLGKIKGTKWRLIKLRSSDISSVPGTSENIHVLLSEDGNVGGFAGCNRFSGRYELSADAVKFSALSATKKVCTGRMALEQAFLAALVGTTKWQINTGYLEFVDADSQPLARFEKP